jgi:predicted MFS family arabinose efflux permease
MDNSVPEWLGDRREQYGKVRLWGAVGWGIAGPEAMGATAQGLLTSVFFGLGGAIGGLGGGMIYGRLGFAVVFRLAAAFALLGLTVFAFGSRRVAEGGRA